MKLMMKRFLRFPIHTRKERRSSLLLRYTSISEADVELEFLEKKDDIGE